MYGQGQGGQPGGDSTMLMLAIAGVCCLLLCSVVGGFFLMNQNPAQTLAPSDAVEIPLEEPPIAVAPIGSTSTGDATEEVVTQPKATKKKTGTCAPFSTTHDKNVKGKVLKYRSGLQMTKSFKTSGECCSWCYKTPGCNAWSYDKGTKKCTLKDARNVTQTLDVDTRFISGVLGTLPGGSPPVTNPNPNPKPGKKTTCKGTVIMLSWYSWQNNSPCNSRISSSGKPLVPYKHVAVPKSMHGAFPLGTKLFIDGLRGKSTAGETHSGWVEVADTCEETGSTTCYFQPPKSLPLVKLYIGDFTKAKAKCLGTMSRAPKIGINYGTSKQWSLPLETTISCRRTPTASERSFNRGYGGSAMGNSKFKCGDCSAAKTQLGSCYYGGAASSKYCPTVPGPKLVQR